MKFTELALNEQLLEAISHMGFENMTPIQALAIPKILENKDLIYNSLINNRLDK